ncbi:hypothetical protein ACFFKU_02960 [Kineococcus gynurae]|uniref:DUF559 domain-containing protein n=1 Tax=Kineococcus gynurae TaxID=452979 RepID=A0ABV5LSC4_9ACTN
MAIEYDGFAFHVGRRPVERDSRRRAELVRRGWTIFTVGAGDVLGRSTALEEGLVEALGLSRTVPPRRC